MSVVASRIRIALTVLAVLSQLNCTNQESSPAGGDAWDGRITTECNVTTIVNESGSVWEGEARLVERHRLVAP